MTHKVSILQPGLKAFGVDMDNIECPECDSHVVTFDRFTSASGSVNADDRLGAIFHCVNCRCTWQLGKGK